MLTIRLKAEKVTRSSFRRFGRLIDYPDRASSGTKNLFRIVIRQPRSGWRIAYLIVRERRISRLERHPDTLESFEPVAGRGLLFVATPRNPARICCFRLDRPVVLKKGVWHGVVSLSKEFDLKIVENATVRCVYRPLGFYVR